MKKFRFMNKKAVILCLAAILSMGTLTGCQKDTKLVFTTGLSGNQIFKIGSTVCTMPEAMVYLTTFYNQYADIYGSEMWNYDFGGVYLEEHVKDVVLSKLAQIKVITLMAEERDIELTDEEKQNVKMAAESYFAKLESDLIEAESITEDVVEKVYREYAIANKVYATITESADMEISDDEARAVTVQTIYFQNWKMKNNEKTSLSESETLNVLKRAKEALKKINADEDFETVAVQYSEDKQLVKSYARGTVEPHFEELLFSMDEGDISNIIETKDGYYIVKCISTMDYEATQENKLVLAEKRKKEAFLKAYTEIEENTHSQFKDKRWNAITLNEEIHSTDANFFNIYDEFVK